MKHTTAEAAVEAEPTGEHPMRQPSRVVAMWCLVAACTRGERRASRDSSPESAASSGVPACYRADRSVLGRESPLSGRASTAPGWIRIESTTMADSGRALLIDGDGAAMDAVWTRTADDRLAIVAFDDFLRVSLSATRSGRGLDGDGLATSDAELVRDSAGQMREMRREWTLHATPASCDSLPERARS